jgi:predicted nuclease of predicted toxin-antitoxin system
VRLKLDENLGLRTARILAGAGHDVATVAGQGLAGFTGVELLAVCTAEERALVTLDLDFANPLRFDPAATAGIAVLRVSELPGRSDLDTAAQVLAAAMAHASLGGQLWVVDRRRARRYEPGDSD